MNTVRLLMFIVAFSFYSCSGHKTATVELEELPLIFPDYKNVVVPPNIAPLNFMVEGAENVRADFWVEEGKCFSVTGNEGIVKVPVYQWEGLLKSAVGKKIQVRISVWNKQYPKGAKYLPFDVKVAKEEIDSWIAYRLIEPGYQSWKQLGIYQRNMTSFEEKLLVGNHSNTQTCLNCHSFSGYSADKMMFHARGANGGTYIYHDRKLTKVNIEKIGLKKGASYPMWHPGGKLIAFSSNTTQQAFFEHGKQPLEVYDERSDLIFYDVETGNVFSDERFLTSESMETYPAWSPDGSYLYFVSAEAKVLPKEYKEMHYSLLRVPFDIRTKTFGDKIDTLYHANKEGGSISYPRISPDGQYLNYTWTSCGTFPIWHKEADLRMMNLQDKSHVDVSVLNSDEADSYHAWSSNGRWIMFGSRRLDGRYTRIYLSYWQPEGKASKPFLLPQEDPRDNIWRLKSYNIPEFMNESVEWSSTDFATIAQ